MQNTIPLAPWLQDTVVRLRRYVPTPRLARDPWPVRNTHDGQCTDDLSLSNDTDCVRTRAAVPLLEATVARYATSAVVAAPVGRSRQAALAVLPCREQPRRTPQR